MSTKRYIFAAAVGAFIGHYVYDHRQAITKAISDAGKAISAAIALAQVKQINMTDANDIDINQLLEGIANASSALKG